MDTESRPERGMVTWAPIEEATRYLSRAQQIRIHNAHNLADSAHKTQSRLDGANYFSHLCATAEIVLSLPLHKDTGITKETFAVIATMSQAAFLHDALEDSALYGRPQKGESYFVWERRARELMAEQFSPEVAAMVMSLTEPMIDGLTIHTKQQAKRIQTIRLMNASPEALLVKMADRLHNLLTFYPTKNRPTPERKIADTEELLLPIFERALEKYPTAAGELIAAIKQAIIDLQRPDASWRQILLPDSVL